MPRDPEKLRRRFRRLNRRPHTYRWTREEIARRFGDRQEQSAIAFVDNVPSVGGAPILLPMGNPTDGVGYADHSDLPLFSPGGASIHDVMQGGVLNCYLLAPLAAIAQFRPDTLQLELSRVAAKVRSRWNASGTDTWLEQDLQLPTNGARWINNTWVPMLEKGWAYWRTKANTYASTNWGNPIAPFAALGWSNTGYVPGAVAWSQAAKALTERRPVCVLTKPTVSPGAPIVGSHAYALVSVNPNGTISIFNPWGFDGVGDGSDPDDGIVTLTLEQANVSLSYVSVTTGYTPPVALPAPTNPPIFVPSPNPMPPAVPVTPLPPPPPEEKPMIDLDVTTNLGVNMIDADKSATVSVDHGRVAEIHWASNADAVEYYNSLYNTKKTMGAADKTMLTVLGANVLTFTAIRGTERLTKTLTINVGNTAPTPPTTPPVTPTNDPIVSIIITRKSGKKEVIAG